MNQQQQTLMRFDPATGWSKPHPSHAQQWREFNGKDAWLFNPWTGDRRGAGDVGSDPFGLLIVPPGEPIYAAQPAAAGVEHLVPAHPLDGADWDSLFCGAVPPWPLENGYEWKRVVIFDAPGVCSRDAAFVAQALAEHESGVQPSAPLADCTYPGCMADGCNKPCADAMIDRNPDGSARAADWPAGGVAPSRQEQGENRA